MQHPRDECALPWGAALSPAEVWSIGLSVKATAGLAIRASIAQNDEYIGPTKTMASFAAREARYCLALVDYFPPLKEDGGPGERGPGKTEEAADSPPGINHRSSVQCLHSRHICQVRTRKLL